MRKVIHAILERVKRRKGQGMTEYGLIIGFVALVLVSVLGLLHEPIQQIIATVTAALGVGP